MHNKTQQGVWGFSASKPKFCSCCLQWLIITFFVFSANEKEAQVFFNTSYSTHYVTQVQSKLILHKFYQLASFDISLFQLYKNMWKSLKSILLNPGVTEISREGKKWELANHGPSFDYFLLLLKCFFYFLWD